MLIPIKYIGGRTFKKVVFARKSYIFKKETNYVCNIPQEIADWLFINAIGEFTNIALAETPQEKPKEVNSLQCEVCGFIGKSEWGVLVHKGSKHKKEEK